MKKTNKRLILGKQTVRDLAAGGAAHAVGGATLNFCPTMFCTIRVCPTRACTLDPSCPM